MATAINFLKNYQVFGWNVREITSKTLFENFLTTDSEKEKKVMMIRIYEENISSSEDVLYWVNALLLREKYPKNCRDPWEFLLIAGTHPFNHENLIKNIVKFSRLKKGKSLLKFLSLGSITEFSNFSKLDRESCEKILEKLLEVIKICNRNRKIKKEILVRGQNKLKHGMVIVEEKEGIFIRDYVYKNNRRRNKNLFIKVDEEKAKKLVETISANCYAIKIIITLFLFHYAMLIKSKKGKKMGKKERLFWEESLEKSYP